MSAKTGTAPARLTAWATSVFPNAGTTTSSPTPAPAALSIATVLMLRIMVAQRERQVTHNKKELAPEPKFRDQLYQYLFGGVLLSHRVPPAVPSAL
ncbi:hypothetical protein GCM10017771_86120 [Streptomyces capitiformicae]|uniref:Uncharacterized protein n=1 Tax=Streptomyces capitiformicae TaxID=2014920 RepID=A0A918ZQ14_9ACTN|nr:hypothetical protein GCM10017771_86120 [Streptomyces capitiformicae]